MSWVMYGFVESCQQVRTRMLLVWVVMLIRVICYRVCPLMVVVVMRLVLMGSFRVANIA